MDRELTKNEINLLEFAFEKNRYFSEWFKDRCKVSPYIWMKYSDVLVDLDQLPVQGVQNKLAEIGSPSKLLSILSELRAAKQFAERNFEVELLTDIDQRFKSQKSPDLRVASGKLEIWVEVMRKLDDEIDLLLHERLSPLLKEKDLVLSIVYSEEISELAVDWSARRAKEKVFDDFLERLAQSLESLDRNELPLVFSLKKSKISVRLAEPGWGRVACSATSATFVPEEEYVQQIKEAVKGKSTKRNNWSKDCLKQPFLIFLDLGSIWLHQAVYPALYGSTNCVPWIKADEFGPERVSYPTCVKSRLKGEHRELLLNLGFDPRRRLYIDKPGVFVTEQEVKQNISGVVVMLNETIECLPNPFCDKSIWMPDLPQVLDIPSPRSVADNLK